MEFKKIKLNWNQILRCKQALDNVSDISLPFELSVAIAKNNSTIIKALKYYLDKQDELTNKHSKDGKKPIKDEAAYKKELEELRKQDIEISMLVLELTEVINLKGSLTPKQILDLGLMGFMIKDLN